MKNVSQCLVLILVLLSGTVQADNQLARPPLRSAAEPDYPPFSMVNPDGTADGLAVELLQEALSAVGREASFKTAPWNQIKNELAAGELDVLPLVGRTPEREALYDFTVPYLTLHGALFIRDDESRIQRLADLPGKRIAVMKGDNAEEYVLRSRLSDQIISTTTFEEAFRMLAAGEADAVIAQKLMGVSLLKQLGLRTIKVVGRPNEEFKQDFCFAVKKGHAELLADLNEGLALVVADGTHNRVMHHWFADVQVATAQARTLIYGDASNLPPFSFLDEQDRPSGFHADLLRHVAAKAGLDVSFQLTSLNEVHRKMQNGELDITSLFYTPERSRRMAFSLPYMEGYAAVFSRDATQKIATPEELKGHRVAVAANGILHELALEHGLEETLTLTDTPLEALALLADGKVDFALVQQTSSRHWIRQNKWKNIHTANPRLIKTEMCFAVQKENNELLLLINNSLRELRKSGEYKTIYSKWLGGFDETGRPLPLWFWMVVCGAGGIAVLLFGANRLLKHQVNKRTSELRASEECFEIAVEAGGIGIWDLDLVHDRLVWDDQMYRLYGIRREDFGKTYDAWTKYIHPDDLERASAEVAAARRGETPLDIEFRIIRPDNGKPLHIHASGKVIRDDDGATLRMIGTSQDITERKTADQMIEAALDRLHKIADQVPGMIYQFCLRPDGSFCFPYASDKIREIYQVTPEQVREEASVAFEKIPPDDYADLVESIQTSARDLTLWTHEYRTQFDDGTLRWLSGRAIPQKEPDGSVLWHGFITDITERKQAAEALKKSEAEFRTTLEDLQVGVIVHTADTRIVLSNPQAQYLLGLSAEQIVGKTADDPIWSFVHEDLSIMEVSDYPVNRVIQTKGRISNITQGIKQPDTEKITWILVNAVPVFSEQHTLNRVVVNFIDITDQKIASENLCSRNEELARFNKAAVGRELRMVELKQEINTLYSRLEEQGPYELFGQTGDFDETT